MRVTTIASDRRIDPQSTSNAPVVRRPCALIAADTPAVGSASMSVTRRPRRASATAVFKQMVVLPTPPLALATAIVGTARARAAWPRGDRSTDAGVAIGTRPVNAGVG